MIRITTDGYHSTVTFPYDAEAVAIIKTIPVHRWDPKTKTWTTETSWVRLLATRLHAQGFDIAIDGVPFTPDPPKPLGLPFDALFAILPERLRLPVFRALSKVLHPDHGGDTALMQQLNRAKERL